MPRPRREIERDPAKLIRSASIAKAPPSEPATRIRKFALSIKLPKKLTLRPALLYGLAAVLFAAGIFVSVNGWNTNHQVAALVKHLSNSDSSTSNGSKGSPIPSTKPISQSTLANYAVAPDLPRFLIIPKIHVYARVLQTGVTASGALGTPPDIYDTAWYTGSSKPGQPGATLIDGHLDGYNAAGVFWNLHKLAPGDTIQIQRGDGTIFTYKVVKTQAFNASNVDMQSAITPVVPGQPGLNLITCDGQLIPGKFQYNQRLIVYATLAS